MKIMKNAMLGFAMLVGAGVVSSANAADIYSKGSLKDGPAEYMPAITWTGFYVGGHVGAAFFDQKNKNCHSYPVLTDTTVSRSKESDYCYEDISKALIIDDGYSDHDSNDGLDDTTWLAGIHLGYNWQRSNGVVFGLEGDVSFADDIDYLASFRGRLGYARGATLLYGTGGVAFIGLDDTLGGDDSATGWVAGLGVEHKLRDNLSIGLEGLYYSFDDLDSFDDDLAFWTVRARLTYHFTDSRSDPLK
jgi:outer membrane immunogenic protein